MWYRIAAVVASLAVAAGLVVGLDALVDVRLAAGVGIGAGAAVFLVVDGSAGAGEGWIYHRVRSPMARVVDFAACAVGGVGFGLVGAATAMLLDLGRVGSSLLVLVAALFGANVAFVYRRPDYEAMLEEEE